VHKFVGGVFETAVWEDVKALGRSFLFLHSYIVVSLEIVSVFKAKAGINELLWEHFDCENVFAARKAAFKLNVNGLAIPVLKNHITHFKAVWGFFRLLPGFYVSVKLAVFGYRMTPKLTTAAGFLAFFEFYPLFLFIFWQLHRGNIVKIVYYILIYANRK